MPGPNKANKSVLTHGWFSVVYWSLVAVGVVAVVLGFMSGSAQQSAITGAIVFAGVIVLYVARLIVDKKRRSGNG